MVFLVACDLGSGPDPEPATLAAITSPDQGGTVAVAVGEPPAVRVLSKKGKPLSRQEVVFSVVGGGGQVMGAIQVSDDEGVARVGSWTLGTEAGLNSLQARVAGVAPVVFTATASAGAPASMGPQGGLERHGVVGGEVGPPPAVLVKDAHGNPVGGVTVAFEVTSGGGTLEGAQPSTDHQGIAQVASWTLGTVPGPNLVSASLAGLPSVTFVAQAIPDAPSTLRVFQGDEQTATVGAPVPLAPSVRVADRFGNYLQGIPVLFEVGSGKGTLAGGDAVTDLWGIAAVEGWTLGTMAGVQTLTATVSGLQPLTLTARALAGPPADAVIQAGGHQEGKVGTPVELPPSVLVRDVYGNPVPNILVVFSETGWPAPGEAPSALGGGGATPRLDPTPTGPWSTLQETLTGGDAVTDSSGVAAVGGWTLGTVAGRYELTAAVSGLGQPLVFSALAHPDVPWSLLKVAGDGQSVRAGEAVPVQPAVKITDRYENALEGIEVVFAVLEGEGSLTGNTTLTDAQGLGTLGSWILGTAPGSNTLTATAAGLGPVTFEATGFTSVPVAVQKVSGDGQTAQVASAVAFPPRVKVVDGEGLGVPQITVTFEVTLGGGGVAGGVAVTDGEGMAEVGSWTLGTVAGTNGLRAAVADLDPVSFSAWGAAGPPAFMTGHAGDGQTAQVGSAVPLPPSVRVRDAFHNAVPGVSVAFSVASGGGSVTGSPAWTDAEGVATVTSWTLGPSPGTHTLAAQTAGVPDVVFSATAVESPPVGQFSIELQFMTAIDGAQEAIFREAAARWEEVIVGDLPDYTGVLSAGGCQPVEETGGIDDVKIYVTVVPIDGPGGVLGQAGPCYVWRPEGSGGPVFPITGIVRLDEADVAQMQSNGTLKDVIIHEMGHVLGIGTLWNTSPNAFLIGAGGDDPYFNGAGAVAAFDAVGGAERVAPKVPVENTGGSGTRDAHWRESVLNYELMTGWLEAPGTPNPLSIITIASLADMGYEVNMAAADPYTVYSPLAAPPLETPGRILLLELPPPTPIFVDPPLISRVP
jgi:adhesin/invasin